jgi:hypothetical protein
LLLQFIKLFQIIIKFSVRNKGLCILIVGFVGLFKQVAQFPPRNNPHGSLALEFRRKGQTRTVHPSPGEYQRSRAAVAISRRERQQVIRQV